MVENKVEDFDELFANMDILELEDIVRNKQSQYKPEVFTIACKHFFERYNSDPDIIIRANAKKVIGEIDSTREMPMNWYCWLIYGWIPLSILRLFIDLCTVIDYELLLAFDLILIGLLISSDILITQKKKVGLWIFSAYLILQVLLSMFIALLDTSAENLGTVIATMLFSILNYVYFFKRWHLFN